jgi:hypothetical protein
VDAGREARTSGGASDVVPGFGAKANITVTIDFEDLKAATADAIGQTVYGPGLSAATIRRLACDAKVIPIVLGSNSEPLDVGRCERLVTRAMRRALNTRDKGCVICGAPPIMCDAHHLISWIDGGETKISNLALLCRRHHVDLHDGHWTVTIIDDQIHVARPAWAEPPHRTPSPASDPPPFTTPESERPGAAQAARPDNAPLQTEPTGEDKKKTSQDEPEMTQPGEGARRTDTARAEQGPRQAGVARDEKAARAETARGAEGARRAGVGDDTGARRADVGLDEDDARRAGTARGAEGARRAGVGDDTGARRADVGLDEGDTRRAEEEARLDATYQGIWGEPRPGTRAADAKRSAPRNGHSDPWGDSTVPAAGVAVASDAVMPRANTRGA